jgi:hypothetical protein
LLKQYAAAEASYQKALSLWLGNKGYDADTITRLSRIFPLTKLLDEVLVSLGIVGFIQEGAHDLHHTATVYQGVYRPA